MEQNVTDLHSGLLSSSCDSCVVELGFVDSGELGDAPGARGMSDLVAHVVVGDDATDSA